MTGPVDHENAHDNPHKVQELILHGDNTSHLYHRSKVDVMKNLEKKFKKGTYDHEKAKKLWRYHADRVAQDYTKEHGHAGGPKWHETFTTKHRNRAAEHWADEHHTEMQLGNFHIKESMGHAEAIVFAAMSQKPVDAHDAFAEAVVERSKHAVDDKKVEMSGKFFDEWNVDESDFHLNPKKKGMWKGWSKADIEKAKTKAKADGNVTREREATFALNAKNDWGK